MSVSLKQIDILSCGKFITSHYQMAPISFPNNVQRQPFPADELSFFVFSTLPVFYRNNKNKCLFLFHGNNNN